MKIPKELLQAPMDDLMCGGLKETFKRIGYGGIPEWSNLGCAFYCYMDNRTCREVKGKVHNVKMEYREVEIDWYGVDLVYPLVRFDVVIYDRIVNPLHFDSFINVGNKDHEYIMDALMIQQWLIFHWYGEDFKYRGSTGVGWSEENRRFVRDVWEKGSRIVEGLKSGIEGNGLGLSYDECMMIFDIVKEKWVKENPLN